MDAGTVRKGIDMFDKFGEMNSFEEINELAENLFNEGDMESIKIVAEENGIPEEIADMYIAGEVPVLCDPMTAAFGKIDVECAELNPKEIMEDWVEIKHQLKMELQGVKQSFVRIGYVLRKIDDQKLYEQDGYKSVAEFAKSEYGLEASTVSRFMSINREYSIDGYSQHLREEYLDLSRSQLEEMLKLPETDRVMIQPETARDDIRGLKRFNKAQPVAGVADDIVQLIEKFYEENPKILNELYSEPSTGEGSIKRAIEVVNPSGNRSFKKGMFFLIMYENKIVIKKFGSTPEEMAWERFFEITRAIFDVSENGPKTWEKHFGKESEAVAVPEEKEPEKTEENIVEKEPENEIAPAQKNEENQGIAGDLELKKEPEKAEPVAAQEEQIPGQMEVADYPELLPEGEKDGIHKTTDDDRRPSDSGDTGCDEEERGTGTESGTTSNEAETSQSNEQRGEEKSQEDSTKTVAEISKEIRALEETAVSENEAIRRKFMVFSRGKMPIGELELVKEHAENLLASISRVISLKTNAKDGK